MALLIRQKNSTIAFSQPLSGWNLSQIYHNHMKVYYFERLLIEKTANLDGWQPAMVILSSDNNTHCGWCVLQLCL